MQLCHDHHTSGHFSVDKTLDGIKESFFGQISIKTLFSGSKIVPNVMNLIEHTQAVTNCLSINHHK